VSLCLETCELQSAFSKDLNQFFSIFIHVHVFVCVSTWVSDRDMGWLRLVGSMKLQVSFAIEPYKRDDILQKTSIIYSILLTLATPWEAYDLQ